MPPALVLTAGLGTRLRPLTLVRAKPAVPIAGEPLVRRIIRWLRATGVSDLVLNLHHLPETIASVVGDGTDLDVRVRYSWEQPAGTGHRRRTAACPAAARQRNVSDRQWRHADRRRRAGAGRVAPGLERARHAGARPERSAAEIRRCRLGRRVAGHRLCPAGGIRRRLPPSRCGLRRGRLVPFRGRPGGGASRVRRGGRQHAGQLGGRRVPSAHRAASRGDSRLCHPRDVLGCRHDCRLLEHLRGARRAGAAAAGMRASIQPRASRRRSCGTMWRSADTPCSKSASSPTARSFPRARTIAAPSCAAAPSSVRRHSIRRPGLVGPAS